MFAGAQLASNYCMFAVFLRGGGDTGAVYHLYSDQPIESSSYSPSPIPAAPQIAYGNDLIFQSGSTQAYAPAPPAPSRLPSRRRSAAIGSLLWRKARTARLRRTR